MVDASHEHIAWCPKEGHASAFVQSTQDVKQRLSDNNTHMDVQQLLLQYLQCHGSISRNDCSINLDLPPIMGGMALSQDIIGWDHFMMGMVSQKLLQIQSAYLLQCHSSRSVLSWISG